VSQALHGFLDGSIRYSRARRYREHWQASVEAVGSDDPSIDAEPIQLYDTPLRRLGVILYCLEPQLDGC
jgi:histidyl-tRNA synthetase